jgi:DNA-directed RNA polymerase subunit RPC12/RpoP
MEGLTVFECPHCGQTLDIAGMVIGMSLRCPVCGHTFVLGEQKTTPPEPANPPAPSNMKWYVTTPDGRRFGPTAEDVIIKSIQQGRLSPDARVLVQDVGWAPIETTPPFSQYCPGFAQ